MTPVPPEYDRAMRIPADDRPSLPRSGEPDVGRLRRLSGGDALLDRLRAELDLPSREGAPHDHSAIPLPSRLATGELAWASVDAVALASGRSPSDVDAARIATAYRSDRVLTIDGSAPPVWSPFSGFWRSADGWVRTHGNYPHHAAGLRAALSLSDDAGADDVRDVLARRTTTEAVTDITACGGLAVAVAPENPETDRKLRERPLLEITEFDTRMPSRLRAVSPDASPGALPLRGLRVLDLTRVIAGPVCTRTLALLGADVLRVDPPRLPEPEWQHLDTGHGKRSTVLDARSNRLQELLAAADAVVLGYRPAALARLGLLPEVLAQRYPGLVIAQLSAWGTDAPDRAGFDSLVQAASGIALIEAIDGETPGTLPAQALDHSAGYLLAAAVIGLLGRRSPESGSRYVRTSLRRVAAELLGMPRRREPAPAAVIDPHPHLARFDVGGRVVVTSRPVLTDLEFEAPHAWGSDQPVW